MLHQIFAFISQSLTVFIVDIKKLKIFILLDET